MVLALDAKEELDRWEEWLKEFHQFWKDSGEPHPNSNKYLLLNRVFFFEKGMERGMDLAKLKGAKK